MDKEINSEDFLKRIDFLLVKQGKKRADLAKNVGFSQQSYTDWKGRNTFPKVTILLECAEYLKTSVEYLITGKEKITYTDYEKLTLEEKRLIDNYRACSAEHKKSVSEICENFAEKNQEKKLQDIG